MPASASFLSKIFGSVNWTAPGWLQQLCQSAKQRPAGFWGGLALVLAIVGAAGGGYYYYQQLPKPLKVIATVYSPDVGHYQDDVEQPTPLRLQFSYDISDQAGRIAPVPQLSAARLDLIGEVLSSGGSISPAIAGKWLWQDDNTLTFTPAQAWPAATAYQLTLDNSIFAADTLLAKQQYRFETAPLTAAINRLRFYQHPTEQSTRQVVATLNFSHPVDSDSVKNLLSMTMRPDGGDVRSKGKALEFSVTTDKTGREVYLQSAALTLPEREQYLTVQLKAGVQAQTGNGKTSQDHSQQLLVPDKSSFLKVQQLRAEIVFSPEQQPEQMLLLELTDRISRAQLQQNLKLYLLPKHPKRNSNYWAPGEVTSAVLQQATLLTPELMPTAAPDDSAFSLKLDVPPGHSVFVSLAKGLLSVSDFTLANEYRSVVQAPQYPKQAKLVGEGALLSLSGDKTLQLLTRGVTGIKVTLHKLLPEHLNHFISQTGGDVSQPYFYNYQFDESNISTVHQQTFSLAQAHPKHANYLALPLQPYLQQAGMGVFFIKITEFDARYPQRQGTELDKRVVLVTDLGLLVKHNADTSQQVFVMSVADGKPVAGAQVALLGKNGVAVQSGTTDAQGSVVLGKTTSLLRERQPVVYLVSRQRGAITDSSFIPYNRYSRQLDYSKFDTDGRYQDEHSDKALSAYMFSDRGIYRPGEQVQLAAIIRNSDLSLAGADLPLKIQVNSPRGNTFWQQNFSLTGRGLHSFSLDTAVQSETGNYHASVSLLDAKGNATRHLGSVSFVLEEFLPDTLKINSRFNQSAKGWLAPADLSAQIQLDNLFGTPAQQRRVSASLELIPADFSFAQYRDYRFITPKQDEQRSRVRQSLDAQQTDADGKASFNLPLAQYSGGTYRLVVNSEGFDAGGGRSVKALSTAWLSPLPVLVAVKADGELGYLKRQQSRKLAFIAVDNNLNQVALADISLKLIEKRPLSSLVKQQDGTFAYQSIVQQVELSSSTFTIDATGSEYTVPTDNAGDFELQLHHDGQRLGNLAFSVVGAGNSSAMLEQNAALSVKLDKTDYSAGDWIELSITAPYTGTGLITIETDKVHNFSWFSSDTTSSIARIQLPADLEGNAYVNVAFVRANDSDALFVSPLSYAVVPFNIDRSARTLAITLTAPEEVRPGKPFTLGYRTDKPADLLLYGVDEGILQVAGYTLPDPLAHYLQKKALQVRSLQMLDLILPEFSALQRQLAGIGGDTELMALTAARMMMDKNLNPFARKAEQPGVFWLGVVKANSQMGSAEVTLPESFSGNIKLMAVAVADSALAASSRDVRVRGPFVLTPEVLQSAAPGDEFDINVSVANGIKDSGTDAPVQVSLQLPAALTAIGDVSMLLNISEGSEQSARFRVKAGAALGEATIRFTAGYQQGDIAEQASRDVSLSIRPATAYLTTLNAGYSKSGNAEISTRYPLHSEFAELNVAASASPLVLVEGFTDYLARYPHGCTEQVVSQVFPWVGLVQQPSYQARWPELSEKFAVLIQKLAERQQSDGGFSFWPGGYNSADIPSIYAMHFLLSAREQGLAVPDYLYRQGLEYLRNTARQSGANLYQARARATAIYLLTRSGEVTTNYLTELHERLEKQHQQAWQGDITASYMAASYQLLQKPELARGLVNNYRMGKASKMQTAYLARTGTQFAPYANPAFQSQLSQDAQHLYLLASHFADDARKLAPQDILRLLQPVFDKQYNTYATAYTVLALAAYDQLLTPAQLAAPQFYQLNADSSKAVLAPADNLAALPKREFSVLAEKILLQSQHPLFYALSEAGFAVTPPTKAVAQQLEVTRDYLNHDGKPVTAARQGDELTVRLRVRSLNNSWHANVAVVDLLPAGFSVIRSSVPREQQGWRADYIDIREDRLVYYATFGPQMTELRYQVKVTAAGDFTLPLVQAESMYDNSVRASTAPGRFVVQAKSQ
ncbi:MG2 domain-containing protein [Rheinheimera gaetbuli]